MLYLETEAVELKKCLTDSFEKEVVAFLNSRDGKIYIGIDNEGEIIGVSNPDEILRKISDIISNNILPNPTDFITVETSKKENKTIIVVHVHRGTSLYYINKYGRSSKGCYIRVGTSCRSMSEEQIEREFNSYILSKTDISQIESTRKSFSFKSLKIYYNEKKYHINDRFFEYNLGLKNKDGKYSLLAELLSDENRISIKIAKFQGKDKSVLIEKSEYGYQCILVAIDRVLNRLEAENYTMSLIDGKKRIDKRLLDMNSVREVFINSIAHNDWTKVEPAVYIFEDRIEIISYGGLPLNQTKEMFYQGISTPRNKSLIRILSDLDYVEQTGHGIPDVIKIYGKEVFDIQEKYINVTLPFDPLVLEAHYISSQENDSIHKKQISNESGILKSESEPQKLKNEPLKLKNEPLKLKNEPQKPKSEPQKAKSEPQKLKNEPQKAKSEPQKAKSEPQKLYKHSIEGLLIDLIRNDDKITRKELASNLNKSKTTIYRVIKKSNKIKFVGSSKSGHWEIKD